MIKAATRALRGIETRRACAKNKNTHMSRSVFFTLSLLCVLSLGFCKTATAVETDINSVAVPNNPDLDKSLYLSFAYLMGTDSNRAYAATETEESYTNMSAKLSWIRGNYNWYWRMALVGIIDEYAEVGESYMREQSFAIQTGNFSERLNISLGAKQVTTEDVVADDFPTGLSETRLTYSPRISYNTGVFDFTAAMANAVYTYDELPAQDHTDSAMALDIAKWRDETNQFYVKILQGSLTYDNTNAGGYDYIRTSLGWRTDNPGRLGFDIAAGTQSMDNFVRSPSYSANSTYVSLRTHLDINGGLSSLETVLGLGASESATSLYKDAQNATLKFNHQLGSRLKLSLSATHETLSYVEPYHVDMPTELTRLGINAELSLLLFSPGSFSGRMFARYSTESRTGNLDSYEFDRTRISGGLTILF